jgi:hypothetical protein
MLQQNLQNGDIHSHPDWALNRSWYNNKHGALLLLKEDCSLRPLCHTTFGWGQSCLYKSTQKCSLPVIYIVYQLSSTLFTCFLWHVFSGFCCLLQSETENKMFNFSQIRLNCNNINQTEDSF